MRSIELLQPSDLSETCRRSCSYAHVLAFATFAAFYFVTALAGVSANTAVPPKLRPQAQADVESPAAVSGREKRGSAATQDQEPAADQAKTPPPLTTRLDGDIPVEPNANKKSLRREIMTIGLMFAMGIGCTILAGLAIWMLQKNSVYVTSKDPNEKNRPSK